MEQETINIQTGFSFSPSGEVYGGAVHGAKLTLMGPWKKYTSDPRHSGHSLFTDNSQTYSATTNKNDSYSRNLKMQLIHLKLWEKLAVKLLESEGITHSYTPTSVFNFVEANIHDIEEHLKQMAPLIPKDKIKELVFRFDFNLGVVGGEEPQPNIVLEKFIKTAELLFCLNLPKITLILFSADPDKIMRAARALGSESPLLSQNVILQLEDKSGNILFNNANNLVPTPVSPPMSPLPEELPDFTIPERIPLTQGEQQKSRMNLSTEKEGTVAVPPPVPVVIIQQPTNPTSNDLNENAEELPLKSENQQNDSSTTYGNLMRNLLCPTSIPSLTSLLPCPVHASSEDEEETTNKKRKRKDPSDDKTQAETITSTNSKKKPKSSQILPSTEKEMSLEDFLKKEEPQLKPSSPR